MKKVLLIILSMLCLFTLSPAKTIKFKKIKNLSSTSWKLTDFQNETLALQHIGSKSLGEITIEFPKKGNLVSGNSGVNTYNGNYEAKDGTITFNNIASSKVYGPRNIMEQEYKYLSILPDIASYKIVDTKTLKLISSDGTELTFKRIK